MRHGFAENILPVVAIGYQRGDAEAVLDHFIWSPAVGKVNFPGCSALLAKKLDVFMSECSLAGYLKENADVLASTPRGSGVKAVRSLSDKKGGDKKAMYLQKASQFEMLCSESQESLEERFLNP